MNSTSNIFRLLHVSIHQEHEQGVTINNPSGSDDYVFLHFLSPVLVRLSDSLIHVKPGDCLIYSPNFPQWYQGDGTNLEYDCFHFSGEKALEILHRNHLPVDTLFHPLRTGFLTTLLKNMKLEMSLQRPRRNEALELLFQQVCFQMSRQMVEREIHNISLRKAEQIDKFREVRLTILNSLDKPWTLDLMAKEVHLSRARFSALWKEFFVSTPIEDLLNARLLHARWLLTNTTLSVSAVADQCGFGNIQYFSRMFHKRVGCAPRDFYRKFIENNRRFRT